MAKGLRTRQKAGWAATGSLVTLGVVHRKGINEKRRAITHQYGPQVHIAFGQSRGYAEKYSKRKLKKKPNRFQRAMGNV